jgi:elongation factor Ts
MCAEISKCQRPRSSGAVTSYIHLGKIGVLVEVGCESDFIARTDEFQELVHDLAMQIAASSATFIRKEHISAEVLQREEDIYRSQAATTGKARQVIKKIVEGKLNKFYEEVCLYEQPFIKDQSISISQLIASTASKLQEKIVIRRFARFKVGDIETIIAIDPDWRSEEGDAGDAGVTANTPQSPKPRSGFAAATPDAESE